MTFFMIKKDIYGTVKITGYTQKQELFIIVYNVFYPFRFSQDVEEAKDDLNKRINVSKEKELQ